MKLIRVSEAEPGLRELLEDLRHDLGASFVPEFFQALGAKPPYLRHLREVLQPLVRSAEFEAASSMLRDKATEAASRLPLPPAEEISAILTSPLDPNIVTDLDAVLEADAKTLLIATIVHASLRGESSEGPSELTHAPACAPLPHLRLVEDDGALPPVDELFREIDSVLDSPFTASEYRAIGKWPYFLEPTWHYLKKMIGTAEYDFAREQVVETAYALGSRFFDPERYSGHTLPAAEIGELTGAEIRAEVGFFARMIPGLLVQMGILAEIALAVRALERLEYSAEEEREQERMEVA